MTISGSTFHKALKRAIQDMRLAAGTAADRGRRERARVAEVMGRRERALDELARLQLPELSAAAIAALPDRARPAVRDVLRRREDRMAALSESIASRTSDLETAESRLDSLTAELDDLVQQREQTQATVADRLAADEEFERATKAAAYAETRLERNEQRMADLERECAEKLPAYEDSKLFRYLIERGFGTGAYEKRGLIRRLDRWVASLVDFQASKRSYNFLRATPELLRSEIARRRDLFNAIMQEVEQRRDAVEAELGLDEILERGDRLGTDRDALVEQLSVQSAALDGLRQEHLTLETHTDGFYAQALERLRASLDSAGPRALERVARRTPDHRDDDLVEDLDDADERLDDLQDDLKQADRAARLAEERVRSLEALVTRYRSQNFDSGSSYFDDFDPHTDLQRYLDGYLGAEELWRNLAQRQRFRKKQTRQLPRYDDSNPWNRPDTRRGSKRSESSSKSSGWGPGRGRTYDNRRRRSDIGETVIDIAGSVLGAAMRRGIGRRGWQGGWSFPQLPTPRRSSNPWSRGSSRPSSPKRHKTSRKRGRGGFTRVDGF